MARYQLEYHGMQLVCVAHGLPRWRKDGGGESVHKCESGVEERHLYRPREPVHIKPGQSFAIVTDRYDPDVLEALYVEEDECADS